MDQIRNAINTVYKEGTFSMDNQTKTFRKIHQQRKSSLTPVLLTVFLTVSLVIGLDVLLFKIEQISPDMPVISGSALYSEKSGKEKDYTVLQQPWMMAGVVAIAISGCFALYALRKKWLWWLLLCAIIIITIVGNMSERIGYRYYVANEADIVNTLQSGVWPIGNTDDLRLFDTITINQYRMSYFSTPSMQGIAFFKHDSKGYKLDHFFLNSDDTMQVMAVPNIQHIVIPLVKQNTIKKLIININDEQIELAVNANRAQLVAVPYHSNVDLSAVTIRAVHQNGTVDDLYEQTDIYIAPDSE
ncbi:hypothetical protein [Lysinibacillus sp. FSL W8-0992]|uniref:hypothetical protein n=1 Tax=Lysinibacillus sp. FSL W8-0992 TaxID=2954643 RepID=UPI0030FC65E3